MTRRLTPEERSAAMRQAALNRNERANRPWTEEEVTTLRELWPTETIGVIALKLKRSCQSVATKAYNLDLQRPGAIRKRGRSGSAKHTYQSAYAHERFSPSKRPKLLAFPGDVTIDNLREMTPEQLARTVNKITSGKINCYGL